VLVGLVAVRASADEPSVTRPARAPRVSSHGLGLGYQALFMRTESSDSYTLHGPSVVYDYFIGRRWGFMLRTSAFFPLVGHMSGPSGEFSGSLLDVYDEHHYGVDGLFMVAQRRPLSSDLVLTVAAGAHVQWFSLAGHEYSPVE